MNNNYTCPRATHTPILVINAISSNLNASILVISAQHLVGCNLENTQISRPFSARIHHKMLLKFHRYRMLVNNTMCLRNSVNNSNERICAWIFFVAIVCCFAHFFRVALLLACYCMAYYKMSNAVRLRRERIINWLCAIESGQKRQTHYMEQCECIHSAIKIKSSLFSEWIFNVFFSSFTRRRYCLYFSCVEYRI